MDTSEIVNIFVAVEGGTFEEKTNFRKKVSQCRKTERGPFGIFKHTICCKISKKMKGRPFGEKKNRKQKSHNAEKLKGGTLWGFSTSILSQNSKKIEGGTLWGKKFSEKKVSQCRKKMKGGTLWSRPVWYVTGKNRKNLFGSVRYVKWFNLVQ